jgi:purine nucleoside permease
MRYSPKLAATALAGLLLATGCTTFEDNAVATDPTVIGLQGEVELQRKVVIKTKQEAYREEQLLKAKESQLEAAQHGVRADEAVK